MLLDSFEGATGYLLPKQPAPILTLGKSNKLYEYLSINIGLRSKRFILNSDVQLLEFCHLKQRACSYKLVKV